MTHNCHQLTMHICCSTECLSETASTMESDAHQDLISQLPDPILLRILGKAFSHENTIDIVRICILLSKRWSNLWASFPNLHLSEYSHSSYPDFPRLINSVLLHRDTSDVHSFYIRCGKNYDDHAPHYLTTWMQYAVDHNVRDLCIDLELKNKFFKLPRGLFTSRFLETLDLEIMGIRTEDVGYIDLPESVHLGLLRTLRLSGFNIVPISLRTLLDGCPVLEDLNICHSVVHDPDICSESLTGLYLGHCQINGTRIQISGSSLQILVIDRNNIDRLDVLLENLPSLVRAFVQTDDNDADFNGRNWGDNAVDLLEYVSPRFEGMSDKELFELQTFHNLKELELFGKLRIDNLPTVVHFLERSPNLELVKLGGRAMVAGQVLISLDPVHKKQQMKMFFDCPHLEEMLATFHQESDILSEWLSDFCYDQCSCFEE